MQIFVFYETHIFGEFLIDLLSELNNVNSFLSASTVFLIFFLKIKILYLSFISVPCLSRLTTRIDIAFRGTSVTDFCDRLGRVGGGWKWGRK